MFSKASSQIREALYGVLNRTRKGKTTKNSLGSGFMIAPGYLVSNSHLLHLDNDVNNPLHKEFTVIRSPDIGQNPEIATLVVEDTIRDLAILQIDNPRSNRCVTMENKIIPVGTMCGYLGFPLSEIKIISGKASFNLRERFQSAFISAFYTEKKIGRSISWYEIDKEMYNGSSGCPGYLNNARVIGVQTKVLMDKPNNGEQIKRRLRISMSIPSTDVITLGKNQGII